MKLSDKLSIDSIDYASQGNAILGIRNSGKSYTATFIAERLMDDGIPFIAFDPIGIWRYLKVGKKGAGYPVVVAGDNGDLPLTPQSAVDIVRAAMKENVSLVVDLYSMSLSKADWRKIVEQSIRLLLYENKPCGLRHIFIEEAAEFCPQRVQSEDGKVYAEIEKLARMGGNASLGYTLINQRPEEVNKAVLELCDCLFLHRQKGRHSLTALGKWLDVASTKNAEKIMSSLPSMEQGQCWVWSEGSHTPEFIHIPEKKTIHPDRKNPLAASAGVASDVSKFVARMYDSLSTQPLQEAAAKQKVKPIIDHSDTVAHLEKVVQEREGTIKNLYEIIDRQNEIIYGVKVLVNEQRVTPTEMKFERIEGRPAPMSKKMESVATSEASNGAVTGGAMRMLKAAAIFHPQSLSRARLGTLAGISHTSGSFRTYLSTLKREGLLLASGPDLFDITKEGLKKAGKVEPIPTNPGALIDMWCEKIGVEGGGARILRVLAKQWPKAVSREVVGEAAGISASSGSFRTYLSTLKRNGLIYVNGSTLKAADELYN